MTFKKRKSGRYAPEWDRGNGWNEVKDEWQDYHKAINKACSPEELKELWTPASGSWILVHLDHIFDGLIFILDIQAKEYKGKMTRKPVRFLSEGIPGAIGIPYPGSNSNKTGWAEKKSWTAAVKTLLTEIIPAYEKHYIEEGNHAPVPLRPVVYSIKKEQ